MTNDPPLTAAILKAVAPILHNEPAGIVVEAMAAAMLATVTIAAGPGGRRTMLRRYVERVERVVEGAA